MYGSGGETGRDPHPAGLVTRCGPRPTRSPPDQTATWSARASGAGSENRAALGATLVLAGADGATTAAGLWVSSDSLRRQAEEAGRQTAMTVATAFGNLAEPSAANIAGTLDIVLNHQLRAQAAATGMLVEAAESAGRRTA